MEDDGNGQGQSHRRTRSAMVSLLAPAHSHRSKSHSRHASATVTPSSSQQNLETPPSSTPPPSVKGSVRSSNKPEIQAGMASSSSGSLAVSGVLVPGPDGGAKTVEETVRTFRLYEALRRGDAAAISRAIREPPSGDSGGRSSIASAADAFSSGARSSVLHLAVQCAELPVIEYILSTTTASQNTESNLPYLDINQRDPTTGNTPLHLAAHLGRAEVVSLLLKQPEINDGIHNYNNRTPLEVSRTPQIFQMLQLARSIYLEEKTEILYRLVIAQSYSEIETLLEIPRVKGLLDLNTLEPPTNGGSTLLHDAARKRDLKLIEILLLHGADPFRRDKKGKLPQDVTKDEKTKNVLKKSPAAKAAARGIEERAVLGSAAEAISGAPSMSADGIVTNIGGKEGRETKGYLKKWTNYTSGYKLRWFVLEDGVLSYYKHQDDIGSACRGAINMRIAKLHMDPQDKQRFEIHGKSSVKYHLKANHMIEAKRWYWTLNNAIQFAKDQAREEERRKLSEAGRLERIREQARNEEGGPEAVDMSRRGSVMSDIKRGSLRTKGSVLGDDDSDSYEQSVGAPGATVNRDGEIGEAGEEGQEVDDDDSSSNAPAEPPSSDVLALTAHSARLQLDLLSQVVLALQFEHANNPALTLSDPTVTAALASYDSAVTSLKGLIGECLAMSKERDAYWRYRMEKEMALRKLWEENMALLAYEQDELEGRVVGERERRKKAKRALKQALQRGEAMPLNQQGELPSQNQEAEDISKKLEEVELDRQGSAKWGSMRLPRVEIPEEVSDSDSDESAEFFDAVDNGEVEVRTEMPPGVRSPGLSEPSRELTSLAESSITRDSRQKKLVAIRGSFRGYGDGVREKLPMDADNRPKISLWGILKSMVGKDMTRMTLPVSFNEPTSLLQRVAEDMEYTDLLDQAADRSESTERMVYVAAFAASEYSSTTNRVAKPFNPLLGETYEYCRPNRGYRFFVEQVSHHPPIGAAWAEAEKWDYWGESAVKSKFYGKSFDINPLGTWFLRLRTIEGTEELYTWKKVTTSVVGIITGSPTVDNYGPMEIKNWTTGDTCLLDFKARGWRGAGAYEVKGRVLSEDGTQVWSIGGRWNDKIYARLSPGYDAAISPQDPDSGNTGSNAAFLVWQNNPRPSAPFNLTPFAITLNALPEELKPVLCPTDTRLRPDQRAMEEGEYDLAAKEKNRLEEKQRAKRRERDEAGVEYQPKWFEKGTCDVTGEEYWVFKGEYWKNRDQVAEGANWTDVNDIF